MKIETVKTIVIAVLVSGMVAFVAGVNYQTNVQRALDSKPAPVTESKLSTTAKPAAVVKSKPAPKPEPKAAEANVYKQLIYQHESTNNPQAINPSSGACGLGQRLPCSILLAECKLTDRACQDEHFTKYMQQRYGTWANAWAFWQRNRWW